MVASSIQALKPNVTQDEALRTFSASGLSALYWRVRSGGPLRRLAAAYVPYSLYRVSYQMHGAVHTNLFAIDAVNGSLDLFAFPRVPAAPELVTVQTRNRVSPSLPRPHSEALLREKVLRVLFQQGFFKLRNLNLHIVREPMDLHVPYWLAFYGDALLRCRVMDAVRRRIEGAKASAFFEAWLTAG
jgi:hypothetical protein